MQNLFRRPSGVYVVRLTVPERLRSTVGKRELVASTGTQNLAIAKILAATQLTQWRQQLFDLARLAPTRSSMNFDSIIKIYEGHPVLASGHLSLEQAAAASGIDSDVLLKKVSERVLGLYFRAAGILGYLVTVDALRARTVMVDGIATTVYDGGDEVDIPAPGQMPEGAVPHAAAAVLAIPSDAVVSVANNLLIGMEVSLVALDSGTAGLLFIPNSTIVLGRDRVEVSAKEVESLRRSMMLNITPEHLESAKAARVASTHAKRGHKNKHGKRLLSEALEAYSLEKLPLTIEKPAEVKRLRDGIHLLIEFEGDLSLDDLDDEVLKHFRAVALPTFLARENHVRAKYGTTSMTTSIAAVAGQDWPIMSAAERDLRMRWIAAMFRWLHENKWIVENPATSFQGGSVQTKAERAKEDKTKRLREPFSSDELRAIFSTEWYKTGRGELTLGGKVGRGFQPFQYWLPLLGLLSGCRVGEASQLALDNVRQTAAGTWYIDINEKTADRDLKTTWSTRLVPLHPLIVAAGFPEWCDRLRAAGFQRVFPELSWNRKTQYAKEPIRAHTELFRSLGIPRNNTKVFHSFRRSLNTKLEQQGGVTDIARKRIMGHQPGTSVNELSYLDDRVPDAAYIFMRVLDFQLPAIVPFDLEFGIKAVIDAQSRKLGERRGGEDMGPAAVKP